jgi:hypothetical protein
MQLAGQRSFRYVNTECPETVITLCRRLEVCRQGLPADRHRLLQPASLATAALPLPCVLGPRLRDRLPLHVRGGEAASGPPQASGTMWSRR